MIIDDLDIECVTVTPTETDRPLPVDSNTVLALPITFQSLKLIRARNRVTLTQLSPRVDFVHCETSPSRRTILKPGHGRFPVDVRVDTSLYFPAETGGISIRNIANQRIS
jgi:hypothetical protein